MEKTDDFNEIFRQYHRRHGFAPIEISETPSPNLGLVVTIPCHDEPDLLGSLQSLVNCDAPECEVEVIVVVNASAAHDSRVHEVNQQTVKAAEEWIATNNKSPLRFFILHYADLPPKDSGVGLARKIAMDAAASRLCAVGKPNGVIACFDADSRCEKNYLTELIKNLGSHPEWDAVSIQFAHPTSGDLAGEVYSGIIRYELYLRYYHLGLKWAGHPQAFHTIGSSMAVRADAYMRHGGMNRRKAGEDFYFLHKYSTLGKLGELNETCIIPSPRASHRVPFGTGKAIGEFLANPNPDFPVYAFQSFAELKLFISRVPDFYELTPEKVTAIIPVSVAEFLETKKFKSNFLEMQKHSPVRDSFVKRFYKYFDALLSLQYFHFARDHFFPNEPLKHACKKLLAAVYLKESCPEEEIEWLELFRRLDRQ